MRFATETPAHVPAPNEGQARGRKPMNYDQSNIPATGEDAVMELAAEEAAHHRASLPWTSIRRSLLFVLGMSLVLLVATLVRPQVIAFVAAIVA